MSVDAERLLDLAYDAILAFDWQTGEITYWNQGAERLYGWTRAQALGQRPEELLHTEHPGDGGEIRRTLQQAGTWEGLLIQSARDGSRIVVDARKALDRGQVIEVNRDRTLAWQSAETLRGLEQARSEFIAEVAHQLRSPVTVLRGYLEMLEQGRIEMADEPGFGRALTHLHESAEEMHGVTERLVSAARVDLGPAHVTLRTCNLPAIARGAAAEASQTGDPELRVEYRGPDEVKVFGDPNHLDMVVRELIAAARQMSAASILTAELETRGGKALLSVIAEEAEAKAGLAGEWLELPRRVARLHGGSVDSSVRANELRLRLDLPLAG